MTMKTFLHHGRRAITPPMWAMLVCAALANCAPAMAFDRPLAASAESPAASSPLAGPAPADAAASAPAARLAPDPIEADPAPTPLLPRSRLDPDQDAARRDLWERVRGNYSMAPVDNELVRKWEQWYASRPDYVQRMTERGSRYLFYVVEEIERRGLPADLALLPFVESAFNPQAMSSARASGMWQFMPATGKDFSLRQNLFRDDRRDVLASTRAALDYLQRLHKQFGDWHLALAAYNWGQGNVQRAIESNRRAGRSVAYNDLVMPDETRNYVPKLQAVKNIVARPELYSLALPELGNHPFFLGVLIQRDIDVALAARLAGLPLENFQHLNPQMNKPVILAAGSPQVLLPYDNANQFLRQLSVHSGPLATWTAWVAPRNVKPADAARLVGMSEAQLREVNFIPERMLVKAGSTLLVPRSAQATADVSTHLADTAMMAFAPEARPLRKLSFKAGKKGDNVVAVAARYKVSAAQVAQWNRVAAQASFKPGQVVTVMVPAANGQAGARAAGARSASKKGAVRSAKAGAQRAGRTVAKKSGKTRLAKR